MAAAAPWTRWLWEPAVLARAAAAISGERPPQRVEQLVEAHALIRLGVQQALGAREALELHRVGGALVKALPVGVAATDAHNEHREMLIWEGARQCEQLEEDDADAPHVRRLAICPHRGARSVEDALSTSQLG